MSRAIYTVCHEIIFCHSIEDYSIHSHWKLKIFFRYLAYLILYFIHIQDPQIYKYVSTLFPNTESFVELSSFKLQNIFVTNCNSGFTLLVNHSMPGVL